MNWFDLFSSSSRYGSYSSYGNAAGYITILTLVLTIAVIVLTVFCYHKFVGKKSNPSNSLSKFFNFDHLYIENVTKILFILSIFGITAFCLYIPLALLGSPYASPQSFIMTLLLAIILFVLLQVANRLLFEWSMMLIRGAVDLHAVRKKVTGVDSEQNNVDFVGDMSEIAASLKKSSASRTASNAQAAAPATPAAPAQSQSQPASGSWTCSCGRAGNTGNFCAACGRPRS